MKKYLLIFLSIIITFSFVGTVSAKVDYSSKIEDKEMDQACTAIACSIILNYLDKTNNNIVPSNYQLPYCNSGKATCATGSTTSVAYLYPNAHNFHRFLADSCSMGAVTYAGNVSSGIATYKNSSSTIASTNITAYWYMPLAVSSIKAQINSSKPCMLTSTFAGVYSWHSMPIYGYRTYDNGSTEYLVHTGWYDSMVKVTGSANSYRMPEIWVSSSIATYGYYFTHN